MAAGPKLDSIGTIKLATLNEALLDVQGVHSIVERMAVEAKSNKPINNLESQLKRVATPLQGQLKSQFQLIADLISTALLISGRGMPAAQKVRAYREMVGQLKTQLEIAIVQVKAKHEIKEEKHERRE
jgi:hypothetical protein